MTRAGANVSAIEQHILAESLRRVARVRPCVAIVMAEALEADPCELHRFAAALTPEETQFPLALVGDVAETGGGQA